MESSSWVDYSPYLIELGYSLDAVRQLLQDLHALLLLVLAVLAMTWVWRTLFGGGG